MRGFEVPPAALIQGASRGIGLGFVEHLLEQGARRVYATSRSPHDNARLQELREEHPVRLALLAMDVTDAASIERAAGHVREAEETLEFVFNVTGVLHDEHTGLKPEKSLRGLEAEHLMQSFATNTIGPMLVAKHFHKLLPRDRRAVWANMSARVGSIGDNRLGGWYGYRTSKAALNQFTRGLSIELGRRHPHLVCVALHPGTVATGLSAPFSGNTPAHKLFTVEQAVEQLMGVIAGLGPDDTGSFHDWAGEPIEW